MSGAVLPWPFNGAERLFRVAPPAVAADGSTTTEMTTGPWVTGQDGKPLRGALCVLFDVGVGSASLAARPDEALTATSTEISVDFCADPPSDGQTAVCRARPLHIGQSSGLAGGEVRSSDGDLLGIATQRQRFITARADRVCLPEVVVPEVERRSLPDILGAHVVPGPPVALRFPGSSDLRNSTGSVHGGVLLCGAEMAAAAADPRAELVTSSIRICYLRAVPAADDLEFVTREIRRGRTQSVIAVEVRDARGKPAVTSTVMRETRDRQGGNHGRLDLA
jgi:uncharacterized protein (TIGR00369 family)